MNQRDKNHKEDISYKTSCNVIVWETLKTVTWVSIRQFLGRNKEEKKSVFYQNNHQIIWYNSQQENQLMFSLLKQNRQLRVSTVFFSFCSNWTYDFPATIYISTTLQLGSNHVTLFPSGMWTLVKYHFQCCKTTHPFPAAVSLESMAQS